MLYDNKRKSLFISKAVKEAGQVGKIFFQYLITDYFECFYGGLTIR